LEQGSGERNSFVQKPSFSTQFNRVFPANETRHENSPALKANFMKKLDQLKSEKLQENFKVTEDLSGFVPGAMVEHQRFGTGKILQVEGVPPDIKATVFFHNAGQKQLLLRFARLRILK
jgi:DNA helicase-2/ATP-dependent DNA helicase PcrA